MKNQDAKYSIILEDEGWVDMDSGSPMLQELLGIHASEANAIIRKGLGVFSENLTLEDARQLQKGLLSIGRKSFLVDDVSPKPTRLVWADLFEEAIQVKRAVTGETITIDWDEIFTISIGAIRGEGFSKRMDWEPFGKMPNLQMIGDDQAAKALKRQLGGKAGAKGSKGQLKIKGDFKGTTEEINALMDECVDCLLEFTTLNPWRIFRIHKSNFRAEYLGELLSPSSTKNFSHLAWDVYSQAKSARKTGQTKEFILLSPPPSGIHNADEAYHEFQELFDYFVSKSSVFAALRIGDPATQKNYAAGDLPVEDMKRIEGLLKAEEKRWATFQSLANFFIINSPLFNGLYAEDPNFEKLKKYTESFLLKVDFPSLYRAQAKNFAVYQKLASNYIYPVSLEDLMFDPTADFDKHNRWFFEQCRRKAGGKANAAMEEAE